MVLGEWELAGERVGSTMKWPAMLVLLPWKGQAAAHSTQHAVAPVRHLLLGFCTQHLSEAALARVAGHVHVLWASSLT